MHIVHQEYVAAHSKFIISVIIIDKKMNGAESKKLQEEKLNTEEILNVMPESGKIILDDVTTAKHTYMQHT